MDQSSIDTKQDNPIRTDVEPDRIECALRGLSEAVADQKERLEKQTAALEKLTQAVKQLEQTVKKEIHSEARQSSSQLDELIKLFVEYDINPQFYHEYKMLKPPPAAKPGQLVRRKRNHNIDK
ncbi:MAG: hypothetical protein JXA46_07770 [Dehalococcoidales bacterium]|nr:hypothetical protein [Dehalococcoidales bacterium]